jgi:hypothetical protein
MGVTLNGNEMTEVAGTMYEGRCAVCGAKIYLFVDAHNISIGLVDWPIHTDEIHTLAEARATGIKLTPSRRQSRSDP